MGITLFWIEKAMLTVGILLIASGIVQYGRRSGDWRGVVTMFFKRVPMSVDEFKRYRLGVALVVMAFVIRIVVLTIWPNI